MRGREKIRARINQQTGKQQMWEIVYALGRILVPIVFIVFGIIQFTSIATYFTSPAILKFVAVTGHVLSPKVVAYAVAAIDLIGGLMILVGFQARWAALLLFAFTALTIYFAHPFWTMDGAARAANQAHALKNLAIMGALLMIAAHGPGRYSVTR
jgi:putative oxidoreductase